MASKAKRGAGKTGSVVAVASECRELGDGKPVSILLVDDHPLLRFALKQVLAGGLGNVLFEEAQTSTEALSLVGKRSFDLVILDLVMAGRNGLEVLQDIKATRPALPILILTAHPSNELALRTLRAGAAGFIAKTSTHGQLVEAVRKVLQGQRCLDAGVAEAIAIGVGSRDNSLLPHQALSNREYQVLCFIGAGHSTKEMAHRLGVSAKTIQTYHARLLEKMKMHTNAELMRYGFEHHLEDLSPEPLREQRTV